VKPPGFITLPLLDYVVEEPCFAAICGLRKAGEAHIRMRVSTRVEPVAQSVEHVTFNHGVQGSNPCGLTIIAGYSNSLHMARHGRK
jgi:hypothetical protein